MKTEFTQIEQQSPVRTPITMGLIAVGFFAALYGLIFYFGHHSTFWNNFDYLGLAETEVCEMIYWDNAIRQPFSTFSNFPYLFFAVFAFFMGRADRGIHQGQRVNTLLATPLLNGLFALNFLLVFLGSNFYHAALLDVSNTADFFGVYASASLPLVYNLLKTIHLKQGRGSSPLPSGYVYLAGFGQLGFVVACLAFVQDFETVLLTALGLIILTSVWFHWRHSTRTAWWILAAAVLFSAAAYACFKLDKTWCNPVSWIQGHFWWHIFSSTGIFCLYWFFRKEQFKTLTQHAT